ncbi:hypothetical protein DFP73DRAFT_531600 [Morchella snyderi]|nr:hypothetical protein DFP73DRAFT_531600 [Morchella snyderi]
MSETPRIKLAYLSPSPLPSSHCTALTHPMTPISSNILVQLNHTINALNRLTIAVQHPQPPEDERKSAIYQLKVSVEVLHKLAEVARVDAVMAQSAAASVAA